MPVFISHSHADREFVDKLAAHLVKAKANVWVDRWELRVGESLLDRIQDAIQDASALLVVLSEASVSSEWCRKELNAGLIRELEERRVVVLPVLLEDCEIPPFLRDKLYADFRENFDEGLGLLLESIAEITSTTLGRLDVAQGQVDWAVDWGEFGDRFCIRVTLVEWSTRAPFSVITEIEILANEVATSRYRQYEEVELDAYGRQVILEMLRADEDFVDLQVLIEDDTPKTVRVEALDQRTGVGADISITCRRLGIDTGRDVVVNVGHQVATLVQNAQEALAGLDREGKRRFIEIAQTDPREIYEERKRRADG